MTKIRYQALVFFTAAALAWAQPAYPSTAEHLLAGYVVGNVTSKLVNKVDPGNKWARFFIPVVITGFAAWMVEFAQFQDNLGQSSDVTVDIMTTMAGGAIGATIEIDF